MNRYFLTLLLLTICQIFYAQKTEIKGVVKDSTTLEVAEGVVVKVISEDKMLAFDITDKSGRYKLEFESKAPRLLLNFKHLSYEEKTENIINKSQTVDVFLNTKTNLIREVVVKAPEVIVKKDTISFNVKSFQGAGDRSIEDVIKKLPGVDVAKSGQISYQGKAISKFNIEGLDMLGGKYSLATKNIEAKNVNRVEVLENYQEIKQLQGKEYSDRVAMNLKLTKEAKVKIIGSVELGAGHSTEEWLNHVGANGMLFKKNYQFLGLIKTNNFGKSLRPELNNHFGNTTVGNAANTLFSGDLGKNPPVDHKRFWWKRDLVSSLNSILQLSKEKTINVNIDYVYDKSHYQSFSANSYFLNDQYIIYTEDVTPNYKQNKIQGRVEYRLNSDKFFLKNTCSAGGETNNNYFDLTNNQSNITQAKQNKLYYVSNNLSLSKYSKKNSFSFNSTLGYSQLPTNKLTFEGVEDKQGDFFQTATGSSFSTSNHLSIFHNIGQYSRLSIHLSFTGDFNKIDTHRQQNDTAHIHHNDGYKLTTSITPAYMLYSPTQRYQVSFRLPISFHNLNFKNDITTEDFKFNKVFVSPGVYGHYIINPKMKVEFGGGLNYGLGDIYDFILQPIQVSYRQQSIKSGILAQSQSTNASIRFYYKKLIELLHADLSINYAQSSRNIISNQQFGNTQNIDITSIDIANDNSSQYFSTSAGASKRVRSIKSTFSLRSNYGVNFGKLLRQGVMIDATNHNFGVSTSIHSDITKKLNVSYSASYGQNTQLFGKQSTTYHQQSHAANLSYEFVRNITFTAKWDFTRQELSPKNYKNMSFLDCNLRYKNSKIEVELMANNLLNLKEYSYTIFSGIDQFSFRNALRGREIIAMLKFNL